MRTPRVHALLLVGSILATTACGGGSSGASVTSLDELSLSDALVGQKGKLRLFFEGPLGSDTDVVLTSLTPAIATVPDHVTVPGGALVADFDYDALALGSLQVSATLDGVVRTESARVVDHFGFTFGSSPSPMEVGATSYVFYEANASLPTATDFPIAVADPSVVSAPAQGTIDPFDTRGLALVTATAPGETTLTGTLGGTTAVANAIVVDRARLLSAPRTVNVETGAPSSFNLQLDATVGQARTITVTSSDPSVAAPTVVADAGNNSVDVQIPGTTAGQTELVFSLLDSTVHTTLTVAAAHLESIGVETNGDIAPGFVSLFQVSLNVAAAVPHDVALASSDPSVLPVPDHVTVQPGNFERVFPLTPLKNGDVVLTATMDGVSTITSVHVGPYDTFLNFSIPQVAQVGASLQLAINIGQPIPTPVTLSSSDPTVIAVPSVLQVTASQLIYVSALKAGTTTLTATNGPYTKSIVVRVADHIDITAFGPTLTVALGGDSSATLVLSGVPKVGSQVTFTTSDATIVAAPDPIPYDDSLFIGVPFHGLSSGTAVITATIGGTSASIAIAVGNSSMFPVVFQSAFIPETSLQTGAITEIEVSLSGPVTTETPITVTFSTPGVVALVDPNPTLAIGSSGKAFALKAVAAGTTNVVVATASGSSTIPVVVSDTPTFTLSASSSIPVGTTFLGSLTSGFDLVADTSFTLTSSDPTLLTVSPANLVLGPGTHNQAAVFSLTGVAAGGPVTITATHGTTVVTAMVTVTP